MAVSVSAAGEDAIKEAIRAFQAASLLPDTVAPAAAQPPGRDQGSAVAAAAAGTALGPRPLAAAARQLSAEVAKCALVWGMGGVNGSESVSLVAGLQTRMRAFTAECGAASAGAGRTLQGDVRAAAAGVAGACADLVRRAALEGARGDALRRCAGLAMERCAAAERAPPDDRTALARVFMQARRASDGSPVAQGMADALREVRESWPDLLASARGPAAPGGRPGHEPNEPPRPHAAGGAPGAGPGAPAGEPGRSGGEQASARARGSDAGEDDAGEEAPRRTAVNGAAGCAAPPPASAAAAGGSGGGCGANEEDGEDHKGDDRDEDSSVLGFEVDELSGAERGVAAAAADLLESARAALCLAARTLLRAPGLDAAGVAAWASAAWHARQLGTAANDLGAGLYAPQDAEELAGAGEAVATGVELLLEELPAAGPAHAQADAAARRAADAHGALAGCLRALADDSPECSSQRPEE